MTAYPSTQPHASSSPYYLDASHCPACDEQLMAAERSEFVTERCIRHVWICDECGYQFATSAGLTRVSRRVICL